MLNAAIIDKLVQCKDSESLDDRICEFDLPRDIVGMLYSGVVDNFVNRHWPNLTGIFKLPKYRGVYPSSARWSTIPLKQWMASLDKELFIGTDMSLYALRTMLRTDVCSPDKAMLPLTDGQFTTWLKCNLSNAYIWICTRYVKDLHHTGKHAACPNPFDMFRFIPSTSFAMEMYPHILLDTLMICLGYLGDIKTNKDNCLTFGKDDKKVAIDYDWVLHKVTNTKNPATGKHFQYIDKTHFQSVLSSSTYLLNELYVAHGFQHWPFANVPPFKSSLRYLPADLHLQVDNFHMDSCADRRMDSCADRRMDPCMAVETPEHGDDFYCEEMATDWDFLDMDCVGPCMGPFTPNDDNCYDEPMDGSGKRSRRGSGRGSSRASAARSNNSAASAKASSVPSSQDVSRQMSTLCETRDCSYITDNAESEVFLGIDPGSKAFKCMRGDLYDTEELHVRLYPNAQPKFDAKLHTTSSIFLNIHNIRKDPNKLRLFEACSRIHPKALIAAGVPPECSPFAKAAMVIVDDIDRYEGIHTRLDMDMTKVVELRDSKAFCLTGQQTFDAVSADCRTFEVPSWISLSHINRDQELDVLSNLTFICNPEPFYKVDNVYISPYFTWALYVLSWFRKHHQTSSENMSKITAAVLAPNVLRCNEMSYVEYCMKALLGTVGIENVVIVPEGAAESLANDLDVQEQGVGRSDPNQSDDGLRLCIIAGGVSGDVNITEKTNQGLRCMYKTSHLLYEASSGELNKRLALKILKQCDQNQLDAQYNSMVLQGTSGVNKLSQAVHVINSSVCELVDSLKNEIETKHREDIVSRTIGSVYPLRTNVSTYRLEVPIPIDTLYVPELLKSIRLTICHTVNCLNDFYKLRPRIGPNRGDTSICDRPITQVCFSGGVFHSFAGALLAQRQLQEEIAKDETLAQMVQFSNPNNVTRCGFGAGAAGALSVLMEMRRQEGMKSARTVMYERLDCAPTRYDCPGLDPNDTVMENNWQFNIVARGGREAGISLPSKKDGVIYCRPEKGVVYLHITALKMGSALIVSETPVSYSEYKETTYYYYTNDIENNKDACGGCDFFVKSVPFNADFNNVRVQCRINPLTRRVVVDITPQMDAEDLEDDGVPNETFRHEEPLWMEYWFPGCGNQWRSAARLVRLSHMGVNIDKGIQLHQEIVSSTVRVMSSDEANGIGDDLMVAMKNFNLWILDIDVPKFDALCTKWNSDWSIYAEQLPSTKGNPRRTNPVDDYEIDTLATEYNSPKKRKR